MKKNFNSRLVKAIKLVTKKKKSYLHEPYLDESDIQEVNKCIKTSFVSSIGHQVHIFEKSIAKIKSRNIFSQVDYQVNEGSENNLKIIEIEVEESPTGEISAGAGIGTSGGALALGVKENNWLGTGKAVEFQVDVDEESLAGVLSLTDPN